LYSRTFFRLSLALVVFTALLFWAPQIFLGVGLIEQDMVGFTRRLTEGYALNCAAVALILLLFGAIAWGIEEMVRERRQRAHRLALVHQQHVAHEHAKLRQRVQHEVTTTRLKQAMGI